MEEVVMMSKMLESSRKMDDENKGGCQGRQQVDDGRKNALPTRDGIKEMKNPPDS